MSFERDIASRIGSNSKEPPETNLEYYAKPENYQGSNMLSFNRFAVAAKKLQKVEVEEKETIDPGLKRMYDRYKDLLESDEDDVDGSFGEPDQKHNGLTLPDTLPTTSQAMNLYKSQTMPTMSKAHKSRSSTVTGDKFEALEDRMIHTPRSGRTRFKENYPDRSPSPEMKPEVSEVKRKISTFSMTSGPYRSATTSSVNMTGEELKLLVAKEKFRHAIRIVLILLKWITSLTEKEDSDGQVGGKTFTDIASEAFEFSNVKNTAIAFDVSQFKARKEMNLSNEVKHVLSIPSHYRTPDQLQTALFGLQHLKSFAEYPLHMQEKLTKVAWFQDVPPKRVIIRQGHFAENFYFILSGQAVVRILEKNPKTGETQLRTAAVMRKGTSFGELALLHRSRRTATVVTEQEPVQLLTIGREDFLDIFMSGATTDGIPDHIRYVQTLDFMKDWPIDQLLERPECCLFHFFKRGVVIVKDSNQSEWIYIVKSGSCQVMKQLKGVKPQNMKVGSQSARNERQVKLPKLDALMAASPRVDTGLKKQRFTLRVVTPVRRAMEQFEELQRLQQEADNQSRRLAQTAMVETDDEDQPVKKPSNQEQSGHEAHSPEPKVGFSKSKYTLFTKTQTSVPHFQDVNPGAAHKHRSKSQSAKLSRAPQREEGKTVTVKKLPVKHEEEDVPASPVFVQVETLKPKDVFGLTTLHFDDDIEDPGTSVSLVSNGAECIMLSKKFFISHANEVVKQQIRHYMRPYPSEDSLQNNLQTKVDWDLYKKHLIKDTMYTLNQGHSKGLPDIRASVM